MNLQMFKLDLEKAEGPEINLPTFIRSLKKEESSRKNIYFCFIDYAKACDSGSQQTVENSERDRIIRTPDVPPEKSVCRSRRNS